MVMKATTPGAFEETAKPTPVQQAAAQATASADNPAVDNTAAETGNVVSNVPAVAQTRAVAKVEGKLETVLQDIKNFLPPVDFGVLPRLVGAQGALLDPDKKSLGATVDIELISWNDEYVVTPGVDTEAAKKDVKYSRDGENLDDGSGLTVAEYLEILRTTKGYSSPAVKQYVQLVCILKKAAQPTDLLESMVQVSLSPQSRKGFEGFRLQESVKVRLGSVTPESIRKLTVRAEPKTMGKNSFTLLKLSRTVDVA